MKTSDTFFDSSGSLDEVQLVHSKTELNNSELVQRCLQEVLKLGVVEFCVCPGSRNSPLIYALKQVEGIKVYYWPEERSAAFFALGRIKATKKAVAVIVTSGTAAGELLPATMEAYYTSLPLILITADRPHTFRGTGAPQSAEQVHLYGCYAHYFQDMAHPNQKIHLNEWSKQGPAHLNICLEEPSESECLQIRFDAQIYPFEPAKIEVKDSDLMRLQRFCEKTHFPLVIVGALSLDVRECVVQFLIQLNAPIYVEGISGIREDKRLQRLRINRIERVWQNGDDYHYPIDGILRLGSVPTARIWRDLEKKHQIPVCSISEQPFSGLSRSELIHTNFQSFFEKIQLEPYSFQSAEHLLNADQLDYQKLLKLFAEEPLAEPSLMYQLSILIPNNSRVYLGNSLPIREWDLAASFQEKGFIMGANRGVNGIDGQLSTFLGFCQSDSSNWAIIGDLTALYDMVAPWILQQLPDWQGNIVIINNSGGQIFSRMYALPEFLNSHQLNFAALAAFWNLPYQCWNRIPDQLQTHSRQLIEIIPDLAATERFWKKMTL